MPVAQTSIDLGSVRERLGVAARVAAAPATATVRGVWFSMAPDYIKTRSDADLVAWRTAVAPRRRVPFLTYPLREFLEESAIGSAIVSPSDPGEAMRMIWRNAASHYLSTAFGRSLVHLIPSPIRYIRWLADHRDHFCNYGTWSVIEHDPNYVTMEMKDELIWLETAHRGGAEGVLQAFGVRGTVEPELLGPYEGRLHIRWWRPS